MVKLIFALHLFVMHFNANSAHITILSEVYTKHVSPMEYMVDATNNLAYRTMILHSLSNRNNFAFSPTTLMSVLVALYEGSSGRSNSELQHFIEFTSDKDATRIGLRDIHRKLRMYSFPQDNPLIGLCLSKENVSITSEYEGVLKFYGYDLDFSLSDTKTFATNAVYSAEPAGSEKSLQNDSITTEEPTDSNNSTLQVPVLENSTTIRPEVEIITTTTSVPSPTTTTMGTTTTTMQVLTTEAADLAAYVQPKSISTSGKIINAPDYWPTSKNGSVVQSYQTFSLPAINNRRQSAKNRPLQQSKNQTKSSRNKRFVGFQPFVHSTPHHQYIESFFGNHHHHNAYHHQHPVSKPDYSTSLYDPETFLADAESVQSLARFQNSFLSPTAAASVSAGGDYQLDLDSHFSFPKEVSLRGTINHIFYLNNHETIQANYNTYNSILKYKYFATQKMTALELELNSAEYNLIIFLPDFNVDIEKAATSLKLIPSLRNLRQQMKPKWIQAIIPDLKMKGKLYLTNDLQNMGIRDIFEPSRADLSQMTNETDIYVKHIEQTIDINIRTRPIDQIKGNIAQQLQPIEVAVNHPFFFFIIDKEIDVAILAGRALNPLNLRIQ